MRLPGGFYRPLILPVPLKRGRFYIDRALAGPFPRLLSRYSRGLRALDKHSKREFGASFEKLSGEQQDSALGDLESGKIVEVARRRGVL